MKPLEKNYTDEEQKQIAAWCAEAVKLYRENVERHGQEPDVAEAKTNSEISEALATDIETPLPLKVEEFPPKSCNRHQDCGAANLKYEVEHGEKPGYNFHCFSEDCEDCFGC